MARCDETALAELAVQLEREDPELARALTDFSSAGPSAPDRDPSRQRRRRRSGLLLLAVAIAVMGLAVTVGHGLLFAVGLVLAAVAQHRLDAPYRQGRPMR